jgi:DNA topoisomerase-1
VGRRRPGRRPYAISSIETKRTSTRASAAVHHEHAAAGRVERLGFGAQRTMRAAQSLYEGVNIPGEGPVGLITYMRTDSTHLAGEAIEMARTYVGKTFGDAYLPEKPNFFTSSNKAAQEAHEAIRPTDAMRSRPTRSQAPEGGPGEALQADLGAVRRVPDDARAVGLDGVPHRGRAPTRDPARSRRAGDVLAFDGFYRVSGVPMGGDDSVLPELEEGQELRPFASTRSRSSRARRRGTPRRA